MTYLTSPFMDEALFADSDVYVNRPTQFGFHQEYEETYHDTGEIIDPREFPHSIPQIARYFSGG